MKLPSLSLLVCGVLIIGLLFSAGCINTSTSTENISTVQMKNTTSSSENASSELKVAAAASLTGVLTELASWYEAANPGTKIVLNFDGSQALATQIKEGANQDLFISADTKQMDLLKGAGFIENSSVTVVTRNKLAILVPAENPGKIEGLTDLARPGVRLVLGTEEVPFGRYTRQMLNNTAKNSTYGSAFGSAVLKNAISMETAVTYVTSKLTLGEADAGIAYASDLTRNDRQTIRLIPIQDDVNVIATYPAGILKESSRQQQAAAFLAYITSPEGAAAFESYGFAAV
ncbi:molybdate ABC transporter substrate-binding protein [Methanosphaerula subterraneus]|uniref:molybdate ABC transporter substrate-binding protein n=1 Tax=Methanosphaerula subterraneus TaxID=3350244 RepID=UPI003F86FD3B